MKRKLRDEHITDLPPALRARRDRDRALTEALDAATEQDVRRIVDEVNDRIRTINRTTYHGPPTATGPLDVEDVVAAWRAAHPGRPQTADDDDRAAGAGHVPSAPSPPGWLARAVARVTSVRRRRG